MPNDQQCVVCGEPFSCLLSETEDDVYCSARCSDLSLAHTVALFGEEGWVYIGEHGQRLPDQ